MATTVDSRPATTTLDRPRAGRGGSSKFTRRKIVGYLVTLLTWVLVFIFFFPVLWMLITSFKTEGQAAAVPPPVLLRPDPRPLRRRVPSQHGPPPAELVVRLRALHGGGDGARHPGRVRAVGPADRQWQDALFFFISTKFMPVAASIIPVFLLLRTLGMLDNLWALGVLYLGINLPLAVWMMRSFFAEVPIGPWWRPRRSTVRATAASCGRSRCPIVAPGAAAAALICFIFAWNEYFLANLLTAVVARTTPPFLGSFVDGRGQFLAILSAASTIAVLPVIVAGWLAQKRLVRGLAMGAVK